MAMTNEKRLARRGFTLAYTDNYRPVYAKETHDGTVYVKLYGKGAKMTVVKSGEFASAKEAIAALGAQKMHGAAKAEHSVSVSTRSEEREAKRKAAMTREERKLRRKEMQKQWTNDWRSRNRERLRAYYREYRLRRKAQEVENGK